MRLVDFAEQRWKDAESEYGDSWKDKTYDQLIIEVQEELADAFNYLTKLPQSDEIYEMIAQLGEMFGKLEMMKK